MKIYNVALVGVVFLAGISVGVIVGKPSSNETTAALPVSTVQSDVVESPASGPVVERLARLQASVGNIATTLNQLSSRVERETQAERTMARSASSAMGCLGGREVSTIPPSQALSRSQFQDIKQQIVESLGEPGTNLNTLLASPEMRNLSRGQRMEIFRVVANQLDTGQLSKRQFLPGYKPSGTPGE